MSAKKRTAFTTKSIPTQKPPASQEGITVSELCRCLPLATNNVSVGNKRGRESTEDSINDTQQEESCILATPLMHYQLRTHLQSLFPRTTPLSLVILHVSQIGHPSLPLKEEQRRFHVTHEVLTQIVANARRAIRECDQLLLEEGAGVVMLFHDADEQGLRNIVERVYRSICLLQAETIVPPLERVTDIVLGSGSYTPNTLQGMRHQSSETIIEDLLLQAGQVTRRLLLRPALATSLWETMPSITAAITVQDSNVTPEQALQEHSGSTSEVSNIPFLHLPAKLAPRLKHLLPYSVAQQLHCVPVGRDHYTLTVAMQDPTDSTALYYLSEVTGMTIFPVSCDNKALASLLEVQW